MSFETLREYTVATEEWLNAERAEVKRLTTALADEVELSGSYRREAIRLYEMLAELGFCPADGEAMPCFTCGAGL